MKPSPCSNCKKKTTLHVFKDKLLCWQCYSKHAKLIPRGGGAKITSLDKALNKIYTIQGYLNDKGKLNAVRSFPSILIGHKVKLVLAD
jgi:hypothetical protein